jgi:hypothetical protein
MAYGPGDATIAATTADNWLSAKVFDLFSVTNPFLAVLQDTSKEPGMEQAFMKGTPAEGGKFKVSVFGKVTAPADGVTRANQVNTVNPLVNDDIIGAYYNWAHYQGQASHNYEDMSKNSGEAAMVDLGQSYISQVISKLNDTVGTDMFDGVIDSADKILSVNFAVDNSGTVGGIDQTDSGNNAWWQANQDTTSGVLQSYDFDVVRDKCTVNASVPTGISKIDPDCAFLYGDLFSRMRQEMKSAQRLEVGTMLRGGAKYLDYDGCRLFRNTKQTANTVLILNSSTWAFKYKTKAPEAATAGWVNDPQRPAMFIRNFNWFIGLGCVSPKHNGVLKNKSAQ